jgi:hypothetical protein
MNGRIVLYVAGAISILAVIALVALTTSSPRPTPPSAPSAPTAAATATAAPSFTSTAVVASASVNAATPIASAVASQNDIDPELDDSWKLLAGNAPPGAGDPFEDTDSGPTMGKLLGKVGAIRYGFVKENTTIQNESAVADILRRAALDIDKLDRGRSDQPHKRMPEYEAILRKLRGELRPHMDGRVMVAGQGWALATEAGDNAEAAARDAGRE